MAGIPMPKPEAGKQALRAAVTWAFLKTKGQERYARIVLDDLQERGVTERQMIAGLLCAVRVLADALATTEEVDEDRLVQNLCNQVAESETKHG